MARVKMLPLPRMLLVVLKIYFRKFMDITPK
jgi:hypothetical protein